MNLVQLLEESTKWFAWLGLGLALLTLISFIINWGIRYRLVGATVFSILLSASSWAFTSSYNPPFLVEGARYAPVVFDNDYDLVIAQATEDFPEESIKPTLEQIAGNLKGGGRSGAMVHIRLRELLPAGEGITQPVILGEVIRDINQGITITSPELLKENQPNNLRIEDQFPGIDLDLQQPLNDLITEETLPDLDLQQPLNDLITEETPQRRTQKKSTTKEQNNWSFNKY